MFARRVSMRFRNQAVYLRTKALDVGAGSNPHIDGTDLILITRDLLQQRQGKNERAVFNKRAAVNDSDDREFLRQQTDQAEAELARLEEEIRLLLVPKDLRQGLREAGIVLEPMDTGAACRTYNVLMAEGRLVAAALIPV